MRPKRSQRRTLLLATREQQRYHERGILQDRLPIRQGPLSGRLHCYLPGNVLQLRCQPGPLTRDSCRSACTSSYMELDRPSGEVRLTPETVLTNATTLWYYTQVFNTVQFLENIHFVPNARPGPATASYDGIGPPVKITPSVIATEYLCQVPERKSVLNLLVSILVADLVFLQVIWRLLTWRAEFLLRKMPTAQYCEGCIKHVLREAAGDPPRQSDDQLDNSGSYSLCTMDSPSASGGGYGGGRQRSVSEQFLTPRPTFQRQYTDL